VLVVYVGVWGRGGAFLYMVIRITKKTHQSTFGLDERPVLAVHLVVQSAGVAQVVAGAVSPPQRGGGGTAVHAFTSLWVEFRKEGEKRRQILYN